MDNEFCICNHCGETFFKEDMVKGICKICYEGPITFKYDETDID